MTRAKGGENVSEDERGDGAGKAPENGPGDGTDDGTGSEGENGRQSRFVRTPESLLALNDGVWMAFALQAAVKLDLFSKAGEKEGLPVPELAKAMGTDPRATNFLVTALAAMDLVKRDGAGVRLSEFSRKHLLPESPHCLAAAIRHQANLVPAWANLADCVRTGKKAPRPAPGTEEEKESRERERFRDFLSGMRDIARAGPEFPEGALDLSGPKRLLDLGGGPGTRAARLCAKNPSLAAAVFDRPAAEPLAAAEFERLGVAERIVFVGGDFLKDELPRGFDAVLLSQVLHGEPGANVPVLLKKAMGTLVPGGKIAVLECLLDDSLDGPLRPALFNLNMLVRTDGGSALTRAGLRLALEEAGAANPREIDASPPPGNFVFVGDKL